MSKPGDPNLHLHKVRILIGVGGSSQKLPPHSNRYGRREVVKKREREREIGALKNTYFAVIECGKVT